MQSTFIDNLSQNNENKVDHLISLVGGNPMPIMVSALLLLKDTSRLWLVHSTGSAGIAERIKTVLSNKKENIEFELIELDNESSPQNIRDRLIDDIFKLLPKENLSIGLDYTGGTKVMAAITYHEFVNYDFGNNTSLTSYLDPRMHVLRIEQLHQKKLVNSEELPLGKKLSISLGDTTYLHNWQLKSHNPILKSDLKLPKTAEKIGQVCGSSSGLTEWKDWVRSSLNQCRTESRKWHKEAILQEKTFPIPNSALLKPIFQSLLQELNSSSRPHEIRAIQESVGKKEKFCEWLDGLWLEYAVANTLLPLKEDPDIELDDIWHSVKTTNPEFEVDIVASRGHQLFLISCTTDSTKGLNKSKAIEIFYRARQLGGDEARICLVCCISDEHCSILREELKREIGQKINVIGSKELPTLQTSIKDWIKREIRQSN